MASQKYAHLEAIRGVQAELTQVLDGMDYCLDWKPESDVWSAREVVYHSLDTPPGGLHRVLRGMFAGTLNEYDLWADLSNLTPERQGYDMAQVKRDVDRFFQDLEEALDMASEADIEHKSVLVHLKNRDGRTEPRTAGMLLERSFGRHWREHLEQLRALRESLGV